MPARMSRSVSSSNKGIRVLKAQEGEKYIKTMPRNSTGTHHMRDTHYIII